MKIKKQEPKQENDYTALLKPVGTRLTAVDLKTNEIMEKIDLLKKTITDQKDVIGILKDLNNVNDTLIEAYRVKEENLEKYIIILKEQLHNIQTLYIGII